MALTDNVLALYYQALEELIGVVEDLFFEIYFPKSVAFKTAMICRCQVAVAEQFGIWYLPSCSFLPPFGSKPT